MSGPDDWVRRGDVEAAIREITVSRPLHDSPASADRPAWAVRNEIAAAIRDLPAADAGEAGELLKLVSDLRESLAVAHARAERMQRERDDALAARPSPGVIDTERMFATVDAMRTAPAAATPAPACARCGDRGCVPRVYLGTGTVGEDDCPACGAKP